MEKLERKKVRKESFHLTFKMGGKKWLILVLVCTLFAFLGAAYSDSVSFIKSLDKYLGFVPTQTTGNVDLLTKYVFHNSWIASTNFLSIPAVSSIVNSILSGFTWLINLLAANSSYFIRNQEEVWVYLLIAAIVAFVIQVFVKNALIIGENRFILEQRFKSDTKIKRIFSPFNKKTCLHVIWVRFRCDVELVLYWFTIIGGIIKGFQYRLIPYLLAENPNLSYKEVKQLSKEMSDGHKWEMFLCDLSFIDIYLLYLIPVVSLLVCAPVLTVKNGEVYLNLRENIKDDNLNLLVERAFDLDNEEDKNFVLEDIFTNKENLLQLNYDLFDLIIIFFLFCFIGWIWEVLLHLIQFHNFVNRGTLYGPWLPIYGVGGTLFIILLDKNKEHLFSTIISMALISAVLEYFVSWGLDYFLNASYWDYIGWFANLNGRICLASIAAFTIGGSAAVYLIGPLVKIKLKTFSKKTKTIICIVLILLFAVDLIYCSIFGFNSGEGIGQIF